MMKNLNKISAQEYLQRMIYSSESDLEIFPIFKMYFSLEFKRLLLDVYILVRKEKAR